LWKQTFALVAAGALLKRSSFEDGSSSFVSRTPLNLFFEDLGGAFSNQITVFSTIFFRTREK
jgi:hypothetical protein